MMDFLNVDCKGFFFFGLFFDFVTCKAPTDKP